MEDQYWKDTDKKAIKQQEKKAKQQQKRVQQDMKRYQKKAIQEKQKDQISKIKIQAKKKSGKSGKGKDIASLKFMKAVINQYGGKKKESQDDAKQQRRIEDDLQDFITQAQKLEQKVQKKGSGDQQNNKTDDNGERKVDDNEQDWSRDNFNWDKLDFNPNHKYWGMEQGEDDLQSIDKQGYKSATGIDAALSLLKGNEEAKVQRHPQKRMKQAWNNYVEERLPEMRKEYPHYKRGKILYMLRQEWSQSPKNPMNKNYVKYNEKIE